MTQLRRASRLFEQLTNQQVVRPEIKFVDPPISVSLAAGRLKHVTAPQFSVDSESYANNIGLSDVLQGRSPKPAMGSSYGHTYSPLTEIKTGADVEHCNKVISDLFHRNLQGNSNSEFLRRVVEAVGELHDNIPSHASGAGYSAAQLYTQGSRKTLRFAVADNGIGLLGSSGRAAALADHVAAIQWCFQDGNTSARKRDDWAQRVPEDMIISPFPHSVSTFSNENHHAGKGLWILSELVRLAEGKLEVWTGDAIMEYSSGRWGAPRNAPTWDGVVIAIDLDVDKSANFCETESEVFEQLGQRLGF